MRRRVGVEENGWCSVDGMFLGEVQGFALLSRQTPRGVLHASLPWRY